MWSVSRTRRSWNTSARYVDDRMENIVCLCLETDDIERLYELTYVFIFNQLLRIH